MAPTELAGAAAAGERAVALLHELTGVDDDAYPQLAGLTGLGPDGPAFSVAGAWYHLAWVYWDDANASTSTNGSPDEAKAQLQRLT